MTETVLIVDDEDGVRRTFEEWLATVPGLRVLAAADAEAALRLANAEPVDLAVLDWNLGSGSDGLRLLEDLLEFRPHLVAILVTGFANRATPLDAMRMGVRDYLDKNHDLTRETFLAAVRKQLDALLPAKRQRELQRTLAEFRDAVRHILPMVRGAAELTDPVTLPAAVAALLGLAVEVTGAGDAALVVRHHDATAAYGADGGALAIPAVPFARTLAASVVSQMRPSVFTPPADPAASAGVTLYEFEKDRGPILAAPMSFGPGSQAVLEVFDKPAFTDADRRIVARVAEVGADLLKQALAERQTHRMLADAVGAALAAGDAVAARFPAPETAALERIRTGLAASGRSPAEADAGVRLIAAVRELADRHGPPALEHALRVVESARLLLDGAPA